MRILGSAKEFEVSPRWFYLPVNPEPWAVGSLGLGKKGGKFHPTISPNAQLVAFKQAIAEELEECEKLPPGEYELEFYFWRALDDYETASGRRHRKHQADATNMQKATEDALQGVLIDNDRNVRRVTSEIVEQGPDVKPGIAVKATMWSGFNPDSIPDFIWDQVDGQAVQEPLPLDDWRAPEDIF